MLAKLSTAIAEHMIEMLKKSENNKDSTLIGEEYIFIGFVRLSLCQLLAIY
jgi:hypothetical protein